MATSSPCFVSPLPVTIFASCARVLPVRFSMFASWVATALSMSMGSVFNAGAGSVHEKAGLDDRLYVAG